MKISKQRIQQIILEEKITTILENNIPYSRKKFRRLVEALKTNIGGVSRIDTGLPGTTENR
jgi:hypothetical protein